MHLRKLRSSYFDSAKGSNMPMIPPQVKPYTLSCCLLVSIYRIIALSAFKPLLTGRDVTDPIDDGAKLMLAVCAP